MFYADFFDVGVFDFVGEPVGGVVGCVDGGAAADEFVEFSGAGFSEDDVFDASSGCFEGGLSGCFSAECAGFVSFFVDEFVVSRLFFGCFGHFLVFLPPRLAAFLCWNLFTAVLYLKLSGDGGVTDNFKYSNRLYIRRTGEYHAG